MYNLYNLWQRLARLGELNFSNNITTIVKTVSDKYNIKTGQIKRQGRGKNRLLIQLHWCRHCRSCCYQVNTYQSWSRELSLFLSLLHSIFNFLFIFETISLKWLTNASFQWNSSEKWRFLLWKGHHALKG